MFCMGCGAEIRPHADVCSVCGRELSDPSGAALRPAGRASVQHALEMATAAPVDTAPQAAAPRASYLVPPPPVASAIAPSIGYGDTELLAIPRDAPGRLVLVLALLLAADLFAPWIAFDGSHVAPARFSLLVVLGVGLLVAAAASVVYAPFRQRAYYAAYPVVLGAAAFGAAATLTLIVGPLASPLTATFVAHVLAAPVVAQNLATPAPVNSPPTLALAADTGLYVFLIGSASLTVAGYQLFVNAVTAAAAPVARMPHPLGRAESFEPVAGVAAGMARVQVVMPPVSRVADSAAGAPVTGWGPAYAASAAASSQVAAGASPTAAGNGPTGVVLPGTEDWNRAPEAPVVGRNASPLHGLRSGPRTRPR